MHLLDTEVVYELRNAKTGGADAGLAAWAASVARTNLFISAITLMELETAAARAERADKARSGPFREWLDQRVSPAFDGRILPVDAAVARRRSQVPLPHARDGLLAATALEHGLTLATRDAATFGKVPRLKLFNPWQYKPEALADEEDWGQVAKAGSQWLRNIFVRS
jgi:predicted nucleic acid-binding protein